MANNLNYGLFVPTTNVWDVSQINTVDVNSREFKELLVRLYQNVNNISLALNIKDSGYYDTKEFVNGQLFFPDPATSSQQYRQDYRMTVNFGQLPNAGTKSVPHNIPINSGYWSTRVYGAATDSTGLAWIPLPFVDVAGNSIQLDVDATNVNITTTSNRTNFNRCIVVLEYLKF